MGAATDSAAVQGRVFQRLAHFNKRSDAHRAQVAALREQLLVPSVGLFPSSAPSASPPTTDKQQALSPQPQQMQQQFRAAASAAAARYTTMTTSNGVKGELLLRRIFQKLSNGMYATTHERAELFFDALVLSGFVTPLRDVRGDARLEGFYDAKALFAPTNHELNGKAGKMSVWEVHEGAIQAGFVTKLATTYQELARLRMGYGRPSVYALINDKHKKLYLFESDCSLQYSTVLDLAMEATVQFDESIPFGIRITNSTSSIVFGVESKEKQDEWLNSVINAGAQYREAFNVETESVKSFYDLKDYDMSGAEVPMENYRGKVLLIVNVSSLCALTPINYPQLAKLDEKYREKGLEILAFPSNQFANQEPGTHDEIMKFVAKYKCQFTFFEKRDVNGAGARPVFTYLKAQLPGSFGNFVKWNFTKFLVDRNGNPVKRFAPSDAPMSFEQDIVALLEQTPAAF